MYQKLVLASLKSRSSDVFDCEEQCPLAASSCTAVGAVDSLVLRNRMHLARLSTRSGCISESYLSDCNLHACWKGLGT